MADLTPQERGRVQKALRDWLHETPLSRCDGGSDTCDTWPLAYEVADLVFAALADPEDLPLTRRAAEHGASAENLQAHVEGWPGDPVG